MLKKTFTTTRRCHISAPKMSSLLGPNVLLDEWTWEDGRLLYCRGRFLGFIGLSNPSQGETYTFCALLLRLEWEEAVELLQWSPAEAQMHVLKTWILTEEILWQKF